MAIAVTDKLDSLQPGAALWILADLPRSSWSRRIDWYLNFQIQRSVPHQSPKLTPEMAKILNSVEFEAPTVTTVSRAPLMIASQTLLPNKQTVVVPFTLTPTSERDWVRECLKVWQGLGRPSLRIFMPDGLQSARFMEIWSNEKKSDSKPRNQTGDQSVDVHVVEGLESKE